MKKEENKEEHCFGVRKETGSHVDKIKQKISMGGKEWNDNQAGSAQRSCKKKYRTAWCDLAAKTGEIQKKEYGVKRKGRTKG